MVFRLLTTSMLDDAPRSFNVEVSGTRALGIAKGAAVVIGYPPVLELFPIPCSNSAFQDSAHGGHHSELGGSGKLLRI